MDLLSPQSPVQYVSVMKGAQLGFTEAALNFVLYTIDHSPAPMLFVQKTIDNVNRLSKQRLDKSIKLCPEVLGKVGEIRSRDSQNTILMKNFPGGILILGGANSAASLRSMPIQNVVLDEEDSYESDIQEEGSPSELAIARTRNFPRRKVFRLSTPAIKETSVIEPSYESGSMERYHVPCPFCGGMQVIWWSNIVYDNENPETAKLRCVHCKRLISEHHKPQMLAECEDYANPESPGARWIAEDPDNPHKSFHISGLYSPLGFFSWRDAAAIWIKANKTYDKALLKVFVNTVLGETWTEAGKSIEASWISRRKEPYAAEVPQGVLLLTAGVDVQDDRLEVEIVGFGMNEESWSVDYRVLMGDTETSFVWEQLDQLLGAGFSFGAGEVRVPIAITAIDSGHRAEVVYKYCKAREFRRVYPVKGQDGFGKGYIRRPKARNDHGVWLFTAFVDELKSKFYSQLQVEAAGPGFCHFPESSPYNDNYFIGLTSERLITSRRGGRAVLRWEVAKGRRNEPLDCRVYAMAARFILNPSFQRLAENGMPLIPSARRMVRRTGRVISRGVD